MCALGKGWGRVSKVGNEALKKPRVNKKYSWGEKHGKKLFNGTGTVGVKSRKGRQ